MVKGWCPYPALHPHWCTSEKNEACTLQKNNKHNVLFIFDTNLTPTEMLKRFISTFLFGNVGFECALFVSSVQPTFCAKKEKWKEKGTVVSRIRRIASLG